MTARWAIVGVVGGLLVAASAGAQVPTGTPQDLFRNDVHARAGITCERCHTAAAGNAYPAIERTKIAPLCAQCHSDAAVMRSTAARKTYPIDQYALYLTSKHGQQMSKGEVRVATCTDCHGAHGILPVADSKSPVAVRNVATTCGRCHADEKLMGAFDKDGTPPGDWKGSVHGVALLQGNDSSAPTCSTCHSAHGPTRAGVASMPQVCAECHVREADLYKNSPKKIAFDKDNEPGCITCHSNHHIKPPADSQIGVQKPAMCASCHDDTMKGAAAIVDVQQQLGRLSVATARAEQILDRATTSGMLVDDGLLALHEAREQQVIARVQVHAFVAKPVDDAVAKGLVSAARAEAFGNQAMAELRFRRNGLAVATILILGFLVTLWIKIRRLPPIDS